MPANPRELPLFKLAVAGALGIFIQDKIHFNFLFLSSAFFILLFTLFALHQKRTIGLVHFIRSGIIYLAMMLLGAGLYQLNVDSLRNIEIDDLMFEDIEVLITCTSIPKHKRMTQFEAKITHIRHDSNQFKSIRPVKTLIHVKDSIFNIHSGDKARMKGIFKNTSKSNSPLVFDYSKYLKFRHIAYQTYVNLDEILITDSRSEPWYSEVRGWAIKQFTENLSSSNVAIASALVLGHRGLIDNDMYDAFAQTGSMHVLAVSGLHVGILSGLLGWILSLIRSNNKGYRFLKTIIILLGIWSFAFITGGSPSVLRASLMFSTLEVGKVWRGHYSVYNSIGAAALALLCIDPFMIFHVGFQLSFAAIISIVMFCPKISKAITIKNPFGNYLWRLMSVAISVQILTLPISLYYFHQFPVYFLITGVTAVVLAIGILSSGLILLFFSAFLTLGPVWHLYDGLVSLLSSSTYAIHSWPYGLIPNVAFDQIAVLISFMSIASFSSYIFLKNKQAVIYGLGLFLTLMLYKEAQHFTQTQKPEIVFYDTRKPLVDLIVDGRVYCYAHPSLTKNNIDFTTRNFRIFKRADQVVWLDSEDHLKVFYEENLSFLKNVKEKDISDVYDRSDLMPNGISSK
tara:strand:+ start:7218 stop:9095 length:1878 start_codon:yes stop_codon:yes gene_type:complete